MCIGQRERQSVNLIGFIWRNFVDASSDPRHVVLALRFFFTEKRVQGLPPLPLAAPSTAPQGPASASESCNSDQVLLKRRSWGGGGMSTALRCVGPATECLFILRPDLCVRLVRARSSLGRSIASFRLCTNYFVSATQTRVIYALQANH